MNLHSLSTNCYHLLLFLFVKKILKDKVTWNMNVNVHIGNRHLKSAWIPLTQTPLSTSYTWRLKWFYQLELQHAYLRDVCYELKGSSTDFTHQSVFTRAYYCICEKNACKAFCGSRRRWVKSDKLSQAMSLDRTSCVVGNVVSDKEEECKEQKKTISLVLLHRFVFFFKTVLVQQCYSCALLNWWITL